MPWTTKKASGGGYNIVRKNTGKVVGHSTTKAKAQASVRARYANYHPPVPSMRLHPRMGTQTNNHESYRK